MPQTQGVPQHRQRPRPTLDMPELVQGSPAPAAWQIAAAAAVQPVHPNSAPVPIDMSGHASALAEDQAAQLKQEVEERAALAERAREDAAKESAESKASAVSSGAESEAVEQFSRLYPEKRNPAITPRMSRNDLRFCE